MQGTKLSALLHAKSFTAVVQSLHEQQTHMLRLCKSVEAATLLLSYTDSFFLIASRTYM